MSTESTHPTKSGALDASGTQTGFVPTTEDLRRLWVTRSFSNYPEKAEHLEGFEEWLHGIRVDAVRAAPCTGIAGCRQDERNATL